MKLFCLIFIVQVIVILSQPCEEIFPNVLQREYKGTYASRVDGRSTEEPQKDECSPFCICSCCSHPMATQTFSVAITTQPKQFVKADTLAEYTNPYSANHSNSIWQPPKV